MNELQIIQNKLYTPCAYEITNYKEELESKEYKACRFKLSQQRIICRTAKITPKKIGQFVTFWKRDENRNTVPLHETDSFDLYVINVKNGHQLGQFILPKSALIKHQLISTKTQEGKRGFRVYPIWDQPLNNQAKKTQKWQLGYFILIDESLDLKRTKHLYNL